MSDYVYLNHVNVTIDEWICRISYTCPCCNAELKGEFDPSDVYWAQEGGYDAKCPHCNSELVLWIG